LTAFWIVRNGAGVVRAASVAEFTDPKTIKEWRDEGRHPELIEADEIQLNRPLPIGTKTVKI
jgi:hypothetical protein